MVTVLVYNSSLVIFICIIIALLKHGTYIVSSLYSKTRDLVWNASRCFNVIDFKKAMTTLKAADVNAYCYMQKLSVSHWSRHAFDKHVKSDHITNYISECSNSWVDKLGNQFAKCLRTLKEMYEANEEEIEIS